MKMVVVVPLLRVLWAAGMFELDCNAALFIASKWSSDWHLLRNGGDDEEQ